MNIEKKIRLRMVYSVLLVVLGVCSLLVACFVTFNTGDADYSQGYYTGLGYAVIASGIITFVKYMLLLKNPKKLKEREIYESDERNKMIGLKTWSWAGYAMFILLYIAQMIAGVFSAVVMNTLLAVLAVYALCLFVCGVVLRKIM